MGNYYNFNLNFNIKNFNPELKVYNVNTINSYIYGVVHKKEHDMQTIREISNFILEPTKCCIYKFIKPKQIIYNNISNLDIGDIDIYCYKNIEIIKSKTNLVISSTVLKNKKILPFSNKINFCLDEGLYFSIYNYIDSISPINKSYFTAEIDKTRFARIKDILELTIDDIINNDMTIEDLIIKKD